MYRGTTPTIIFKIKSELDFEEIDKVEVTLKSISHILTKGTESIDIDPEEKIFKLFLTQEETLAFGTGDIKVQVRVLDKAGVAVASAIKNTRMNPILAEGVIE